MKGYPQKRAPRRRQPETDTERLDALRAYAIKLYDKGDGHGVEWARVAAACFRVGFGLLRELPPDDRSLHSVVRRAHDAAYSLMTGSLDSGATYTADKAERPPFMPEPARSPKLDHTP